VTEPFNLTDEQISCFREKGFLQVDFSLDEKLLDTIVEKVNPLYDQQQLQQRVNGTRAQDAWKQVDEVRLLATDARIFAALEQLLGRKPLPFQTLNFPMGTAQQAHSDTIHFNSIPKGYMVGVWVALEDTDDTNGPLLYYPGSHKLDEHSMKSFGFGPRRDNYPKYEQQIQHIIEEQGLVVEYGLMKKGMAFIWHANLLHGGAPQKDLTRSRHSQVTHYYFEGCKYYTPLYSRFLRRQYRLPFWIPDTPDYELPEDKPRFLRWYQRFLMNFKRTH